MQECSLSARLAVALQVSEPLDGGGTAELEFLPEQLVALVSVERRQQREPDVAIADDALELVERALLLPLDCGVLLERSVALDVGVLLALRPSPRGFDFSEPSGCGCAASLELESELHVPLVVGRHQAQPDVQRLHLSCELEQLGINAHPAPPRIGARPTGVGSRASHRMWFAASV
jgi:hypothetical protein